MKLIENIKENKIFDKQYTASLVERLRLSKICLLIITAIRSMPQNWKGGAYDIINEKAGLEVWISSGRSGLKIKGHNITPQMLNETEKDAIWSAYIWWVEEQKITTEMTLEQAIGGIDVELFR